MLSSSVWRGSSHWWFVAGLLAGGFATALLLVTLGSLVLRPFLPWWAGPGLLIVLTVAVLLREVGLIPLPLPQNARQVPEVIAGAGPRLGPLLFGFEMGTGLRTFMTSGLPHVLALGLALVAPYPAALLAGLGFGAGRALMTLSRVHHRDEEAWDTTLTKGERWIRACLAVGGTAVVLCLTIPRFM